MIILAYYRFLECTLGYSSSSMSLAVLYHGSTDLVLVSTQTLMTIATDYVISADSQRVSDLLHTFLCGRLTGRNPGLVGSSVCPSGRVRYRLI